jgi:8-oxo-dGTP diphosphatase
MILVTAGLISDGERLLVCQRRPGGVHPLQWEFPGGKVEPGESPVRCLERELHEELGIEAEAGPELCRVDHAYDGGSEVRLVFFRVRAYRGTPMNFAFAQIAWVRPGDLRPEDFLAADRELVRRLRDGEVRV